MKILSMQATFGKLENETISFRPDLNVIHAPNEWGKSTWCAFIAAMLYGIDTRERTTQTALADKERYAPWSGKPMAGRMELEHNGKKITIERSSKGRSIFGVFKAYETESGLPIESLTGENCGIMLLGVEKSVFLKSAFIRQNDLQVTQDEALRRRLNALVTTGDESGASDRLAQKLKELKNACRHNKTGLLPQLESARNQTQGKLEQLRTLRNQAQQYALRGEALTQELRALENHADALSYQAAQADRAQVEKAKEAYNDAFQKESALTGACAALPSGEDAANALEQLNRLQEQFNALQQQESPVFPAPPAQKAPFHGLDAQQAQDMVNRDIWQYQALKNTKQYIPYALLCVAGLILSVVMAILPQTRNWFMIPVIAGGLPLIIKRIPHIDDRKQRIELENKYSSDNPTLWQAAANSHIQALQTHEQAMADYETRRNTQRQQRQQLEQEMMAVTQGAPVSGARKYWQQVQEQHRALAEAKNATAQALAHAQAMESMVRKVEPPKCPDTLTYSPQETAQRISAATAEQKHLQHLLGQAQGQADTLGDEDLLVKELNDLEHRIGKLEAVNDALILAQQTLDEAALELQRQFAPRISKRAGQIFGQLTAGRYNRLTLDQELSLHTAADGEDTLMPWLWRSNGTVDQLYLALRLAVAEELTPDTPLILDDALIQFDDDRMVQALQILSETAIHRQVILFSCQKREKAWKNE